MRIPSIPQWPSSPLLLLLLFLPSPPPPLPPLPPPLLPPTPPPPHRPLENDAPPSPDWEREKTVKLFLDRDQTRRSWLLTGIGRIWTLGRTFHFTPELIGFPSPGLPFHDFMSAALFHPFRSPVLPFMSFLLSLFSHSSSRNFQRILIGASCDQSSDLTIRLSKWSARRHVRSRSHQDRDENRLKHVVDKFTFHVLLLPCDDCLGMIVQAHQPLSTSSIVSWTPLVHWLIARCIPNKRLKRNILKITPQNMSSLQTPPASEMHGSTRPASKRRREYKRSQTVSAIPLGRNKINSISEATGNSFPSENVSRRCSSGPSITQQTSSTSLASRTSDNRRQSQRRHRKTSSTSSSSYAFQEVSNSASRKSSDGSLNGVRYHPPLLSSVSYGPRKSSQQSVIAVAAAWATSKRLGRAPSSPSVLFTKVKEKIKEKVVEVIKWRRYVV